MAAPFRTKAQRELRLAQVANCLARSYTHEQIAAELGGSRQQADYDARVVIRRWKQQQTDDVAAYVAKLEAQLDWIIRESSGAWEKSKGERRSTRTRQRKLPPGVMTMPPPGPVDSEDMASLVRFCGSTNGYAAPDRVESEAMVRVEQRDPDPRYLEVGRKAVMDKAELRGLREQPLSPSSDSQQAVSRIVVYMDRGAEPDEPLPPGDGPVIDVAPTESLPSS